MTSSDEVERQLAALRQAYVRQLPEKIQRIDQACSAFLSQPWDEERCAAACRSAHSLAGSSGTYGFPELGKAAKALELVLKPSQERREGLTPAEAEEAGKRLALVKELAAAAGKG